MPDINLTLTLQPSDETQDNGSVSPNGAAVSLQLDRGPDNTVPNYGIAVCTRAADGSLAVERVIIRDGQYPSPQNPNAPAPVYPLGTPAQLTGRVVVVLADGVALPPNTVGHIVVMLSVLQPTAAQTPRRVKWVALDTQAIQVSAQKFNLTFAVPTSS